MLSPARLPLTSACEWQPTQRKKVDSTKRTDPNPVPAHLHGAYDLLPRVSVLPTFAIASKAPVPPDLPWPRLSGSLLASPLVAVPVCLPSDLGTPARDWASGPSNPVDVQRFWCWFWPRAI